MGAQHQVTRCSKTVLAVGLSVVGLAGAAAPAVAKPPALKGAVAEQIAALQQIKRSLTPAERKLDSRLAVTLRQSRGSAPTRGMTRLDMGIAVSKAGRTEVDVRADAVDQELVERLEKVGAEVRHAAKDAGSVRASLPLAALKQVASWGDVRKVAVAAGAITARQTRPGGVEPPAALKEQRAKRLDKQLGEALRAPALAARGSVVSEGDRAHGADEARALHQVQGTGVKICALSDGVDSLAASAAAGELPEVDVLPGQQGNGDEGTAMLEIIHDLAPNAQLGFATAFTSDSSFAENIRALRFEADCDVIVDDVLYFNEHPFQDGPIAQSVDAVVADGALYFSSAGNEGNTLDGTSGNYEADFTDAGVGVGKFAGRAHDFDPGPGVQIFEPISDASSASVPVTLFWAEPLGGAGSDYDLYLFDAAGNIVNFSQDVQNGDDDPMELLGTPLFGGRGLRLAVVKYSGDARYFQLSALRSRFKSSADGLIARATPGITRGHSAAAGAFSTAAAPAAAALPFALEPGDPGNPSGPFPELFGAAQAPERFTSDGPRRLFFNANGSPITPGNYSSTGGLVRQKPDIAAADGVMTSVDGFAPFFGTSAAAPHAAAIAGLVLSGNPGATAADVRDAFDATALDLAPTGVDARTGSGLIRADRVLDHTGATPQPLVRVGALSATPTEGDGDEFLEPGEQGTVTVPAINTGDGEATGVSVTVASADSTARITPRSRSYGSLVAGETKTREFGIAVSADHPRGKPVALSVRATFAGTLSPTAATLRLPTGVPASAPTTFSYAGSPVAIPDLSTAGATVTIPVPADFGYVAKATFSIDGAACNASAGATTVGINHTFVGDLVGILTAPDGTSATLFQGAGSSGNNLCKVVFDDAAAEPFISVQAAHAPFTGSWRPATPLAALQGAAAGGDWKLKVVDTAHLDTGSIRAVSLHLTGYVTG